MRESKLVCAAWAASLKDVAAVWIVTGSSPVNHPVVVSSAGVLRVSIGVIP